MPNTQTTPNNLTETAEFYGAHRLGFALVETCFYALENAERTQPDLESIKDTLALAVALLSQ